MGRKRRNGEGSWGIKTIKGVTYKYYRDSNGKYFYGKTEKEINEKRKKYDQTKINNTSTFKEYLYWYINTIHKNTVERTTYELYMRNYKVITNSEHYNIGRIQMGSFNLNKNYLQEYINAITPYYALNSIKGQWTVIKMAMSYAEDNNMVVQGIVKGVKLPKESAVGVKAKTVPFLSKKEADAMYKELNAQYKTGNPKYTSTAWAVILLIHTGLRIGELKALKWNDIDFENKTITIDESMAKIKDDVDKSTYKSILKKTKNKSSTRIVPLDSIAIEMIKRFDEYNPKHTPNDIVCLSQAKEVVKQQNIHKVANRMLKAIGSEKKISPHGLRHTFGSILYEKGVPLKVISKLLGHSSITTTANIYIGIEFEQMSDAVGHLELDDEKDNNKS